MYPFIINRRDAEGVEGKMRPLCVFLDVAIIVGNGRIFGGSGYKWEILCEQD